jgi:hypothetical protein
MTDGELLRDFADPDSIEKILDWPSGKPRLKEFKAACDAYTAEDLYAFLGSTRIRRFRQAYRKMAPDFRTAK